jgi:hypothetical protein
VYVAFDVLSAAVYVVVAFGVAQSADGRFERASLCMAGAALAAATGTLCREKTWGHWLAVVSLCVILGAAVILLVLLAISVAFLAGVYGALGKGATIVAIVAMALVVELYVLVPAFQLRYLLGARPRP